MGVDNKKNNKGDDKKPSSKDKVRRYSRRLLYASVASAGIVAGAAIELHTSLAQSRVFHSIAKGRKDTDTKTTSPTEAPPAAGPYDQRLGYTETLAFRERLTAKGYEVKAETVWQDRHVMGVQLFPIYNEKAQAGLRISDDTGKTLYASSHPGQVYATFDDIPPALVNSLLFVENRDLLGDNPDTWNPAIEWDRLANAFVGYGLKKVGIDEERSGGSTLATQIEKFRHSEGGITGSPRDKLQQMLTASVRAYKDGHSTVDARRKIVLDYLNSMPLSSYPGNGEVTGYGEGISLWFGMPFDEANRLLKKPESQMNDDELRQAAKVYRSSLALVMAVKKPSAYLLGKHSDLEERIDKFLPLLVEAKVISPRMKAAVQAERLAFTDPKKMPKPSYSPQQKSAEFLRIELMQALNVRGGLYGLDHLDMTAKTTVDAEASAEVTRILRGLNDPETARTSGMTGFRLLSPGNTENVIYSFTLYEKMADGSNVLRVQTDNFNGPLNLNEGTKMELGSTAKLRTMVSYLEAISELHAAHSGKTPEELAAIPVSPSDHLTRWAIDYLSSPDTDKSPVGMLEASLERTYSGNPGERFFTGGGLHAFENYESFENHKNYSVKEALHLSVNLSFIRIMRDVVNYNLFQKVKVDPAIYDDVNSPERQKYLEQFVDQEGKSFLWKFWKEQKDKTPEETAALLAAKTRRTPTQLAVIYRSMFPDAPYEDMAAFIRKECPKCKPDADFRKTYEAYAQDKFNLNDRGYLAKVHPLALWLAEHKAKNPETTWTASVEASADARQEVYKWLFLPSKKAGQDIRIRTMLEQEAFKHIHASWQKTGYSFSTLVPSLATALGSSGDTPAALSKLAGILQNDGMLVQPSRFRNIHLAPDTPYALEYAPKQTVSTRILPPEVARLVRREMQGVVDHGTAVRARNSVKLSDGRVLPVGGKTGTGDNRMQSFAANGAVKSSEAKSRTATFVYTIDDKFYGCITVYVGGSEAGEHKFTSSLSAQVFKTLVPAIRPVLDRAYGVTPPAPAPEAQKDVPKEPAKAEPKASPKEAPKLPAAAPKPPTP